VDRRALIAALGVTLGACGGLSHPAKQPTAASVCRAERQAAAHVLGPATAMRIADSDPANIECLIDGHGLTLDVVAQASPQAWTEYDTETVHLAQVFGPSSVHNSSELPVPVPSVAGNAVWVGAQSELIATNGTQTTGGSYVTVTVKRTSAGAPGGLPVAKLVGRATLSAAPRGSNPGS
jgi:hypothetical protein